MLSSAAPRPWVSSSQHALTLPPNLRLVRRVQPVRRNSVDHPGIDPLIERAQAGDERAFQEVFKRHRADVTRLAFRLLGPGADLEDVVQDTFVHVFRSIRSFKGEAKFSTWLYRLTTNVVRMHLRAKRSRPRVVTNEVPEAALLDTHTQEMPDAAASRHERARVLYQFLDQLSDKKRTVLVLHDLEGVSAEEIAAIVEAPILTVRTRLFYARRELAEALAKTPTFATQTSAHDSESDPGAESTS